MVSAIVVAAGKGARMGNEKNKVLLQLSGVPVLLHSVSAMIAVPEVVEVIVVAAESDIAAVSEMLTEAKLCKKWLVVQGGRERQDSVNNALDKVSKKTDYILVHDAARPLVSIDKVREAIREAKKHRAACLAMPVKDTIKVVDEERFVLSTPARSTLWAMQTPQVFETGLLQQAYELVQNSNAQLPVTDDAALVEKMGVKVKLVEGGYENIKITTPEDMEVAKAFLALRSLNDHNDNCLLPDFRIGMGYDVHRFKTGRKLILGGVDVPHSQGLDGHSDADVLLHALKDALLGAAALGDIGKHFPDTDSQFKGISSLLLLSKVYDKIKQEGFAIVNVDVTIVAQKPKLAPYIENMRSNVAEVLNIHGYRVNIKATTTEKLGFAGREEGVAAYAVVMLYK